MSCDKKELIKGGDVDDDGDKKELLKAGGIAHDGDDNIGNNEYIES